MSKRALVVGGFHRSGTSLTAQLLARSGLDMGGDLMGGNISNPDGHFEDWDAVKIHDAILNRASTSWQYCGPEPITPEGSEVGALRHYISERSKINDCWGLKDPRVSLFLPVWHELLDGRGRYLFVLRHWACCIKSLKKRHSRELAHKLPHEGDGLVANLSFWTDVELAAKMWLAYNEAILSFVKGHPKECLVVPQKALIEGYPLVREVSRRFDIPLRACNKKIVSPSLTDNTAEEIERELITPELCTRLEKMWRDLNDVSEVSVDPPKFTLRKNDGRQWLELSHNETGSPQSDINASMTPVAPEPAIEDMDAAELDLYIGKALKQPGSAGKEARLRQAAEKLSLQVPLTHDQLIKLGRSCQELKEYKEAEVWFLRAIAIGPAYPYLYMHVGEVLERQGMAVDAERFYRLAMEKNPNNPAFPFRLGKLCQAANRLEEAADYFRQSMDIDPKPHNVNAYCTTMALLDRVEEAFESAEKKYLESGDPVVGHLLTNIAFALDYKKGKRMYEDLVGKQLLGADLDEWFANIVVKVKNRSAAADLYHWITSHWKGIVPIH